MNDETQNPGSESTFANGPGQANSGHVTEAAGCSSCGYPLSGLPEAGPCPECGVPIEVSLPRNRLSLSSPEYLRSLASGLRWVTVSILLAIVLGILVVLVPVFVLQSATPTENQLYFMTLAFAGLGLVTTLAITWGWWRFSEPDPRYEGTSDGSGARRTLRVLLLVSLGMHVVGSVPDVLAPAIEFPVILVAVMSLLALVAWAIQFIVSMNYLMWILARIPDFKEREKAARFRWLGPVLYIPGMLIIIGPLIALVMYWNMLDRTRKKIRAIHAGMGA